MKCAGRRRHGGFGRRHAGPAAGAVPLGGGNAPAETEYTENDGGYFDDPGFRPYITSFPVPEGTAVKGAVLICPGG